MKRMRLGTRSCAECRRRRVRCVVPTGSQACEACLLHGTTCRPQQQGDSSVRTSPVPTTEELTLHRRVEELEGIVRTLQNTPQASDGSSPLLTNYSGRTPASLARIESAEIPSGIEGGLSNHCEDTTSSSDHAPLISLIKNVMKLEAAEDRPAYLSKALERNVHDTIKTMDHLLPNLAALHTILEATEPYWAIWPTYYYGNGNSEKLQMGMINEATNRIMDALRSSQPQVVAKALLWLALCLQQLALISNDIHSGLPAPTGTLVDSYMKVAKTLLEILGYTQQTLEIIECYLFQYKLSMNAGKPRRAWLFTRQAMNAALLLDVHHPSSQTSDRHRYVWQETWHNELSLCLILGLPFSLNMSHPSLAQEFAPSENSGGIYRGMSRLAYKIIERDQLGELNDYATTMRIDQDWEDCHSLIPSDWLDSKPWSGDSFVQLYFRGYTVMIFFTLRKLIHMPYMLKAQSDRKYEHSRIAAMAASRQVIQAYRQLRENEVTQRTMCEIMDFEAFSGGIALAANLLSGSSSCATSEEGDDWALLGELAACLSRVSVLADCPVSAHGAHALEVLINAQRGSPEAPAKYEATIPYFGKVYLTCNRLNQQTDVASASRDQSNEVSSPAFDIDFNVDLFDYSNLDMFDIDSDLRMDWTTFFEP